MLESAKGNWPEDLLCVLLSNWMIACAGIGESLFSLVYGMEDVVLAELYVLTYRKENSNKKRNDTSNWQEFNFLEERKE